MSITVRNCFEPKDHEIHVSDPSLHPDRVTYLCPGGRAGDRAIREADSLADLVDEIRGAGGWIGGRKSSASQPVSAERDEPDFPTDVDALADHAADLYERQTFR